MIIEGKPELGLQQHQQEAYTAITNAYKTRNKASVVIPTGCGKSFISLQLMIDNKDKNILFMAPTNAIKNQMYNYIAKYIVGEETTKERTARIIAEDYFPNLKIMLYPSLLRVKDEQLSKLNADIIIMDELHRTGANKWGKRINTLLEENPNARILGLTATPDRMDDKNVVDELFEGNIDYELTLIDALRDGIVKSPTYVKCDYALGEYLEGIRIAIANCSDENTKKELQDKYDKMRRIVEHADGIPELFAKNIKKKDGKYIIFCKDKEHMVKLMNKAKEWFASIDTDPEIYSVFSGEGYTEKSNKEAIENFENSKSNHIKLLFSIEMLNEGLHVEDISGVIMARPTDSRIIYLQQLGRALSSDTSRDKTIVFDLVNNYLNNNLDAEINKKRKGETRNIEGGHTEIEGVEGTTDIENIDIFRIQGETQAFLDLLSKAQEIIFRSDYLTNARTIKAWIEKSGDTKPPSASSNDKEEKRLGKSLSSIREDRIKPYMALQTDEERIEYRKKYPYIDEVLAIVNEIDENNISIKLSQAIEIKSWMEKSGGTKPPSASSKNEEEKELGVVLGRIRSKLIKPYMSLSTEDDREKFRETYPEIDEVLAIVNEIDENNLHPYLVNARKIKEWIKKSGDTLPPRSTANDDEEKSLGNALVSIRHKLIKPYMSLSTDEERTEYRKKYPYIDEVLAIVNEIDENNIPIRVRRAMEIKAWVEKSGNSKLPSPTAKTDAEKRMGSFLVEIRRVLIKPYMALETEDEINLFRENHPEIDDVLDIISELDMQCGSKKRRELAILIRQDIEKRKALRKAKELEQKCKQKLSTKREEAPKNTQEQGVDFDEQ